MYFEYGPVEVDYLKQKDKKLAGVIERIGHINRVVDNDLFSSVVHHIVGQQISTKAQQTIWQRMECAFKVVTPEALAGASVCDLQQLGIPARKAHYINSFATKVVQGEFDLDAVAHMPDEQAIEALVSLKGIGIWTAEMILLFGLERPNILSYSDLAIQRGMRMVYRHRAIDKKLFDRYRRRLSPYCSVASLYFWAVAGGAAGLTDPAARRQ